MRVIVQRVTHASCEVEAVTVSKIDKGLLLLVGFTHTDTLKEVEYCAKKIAKLRVFEDEDGKLNIAIKDLNYGILSISQFTVYADTSKGNRPSFTQALNPEDAKQLYDAFNQALKNLGLSVKIGVFGAHMAIHLVNDGPVTVLVERDAR